MAKNYVLAIALLAVVTLFTGCSSTNKIAYFQGIENVDLSKSKGLYDARIMPKDVLTIAITTTDPQAAAPFSLNDPERRTGGGTNNQQQGYGSYLVDNNGDINFPVLGHLHVTGMTRNECEDFIKDKITPYMSKTETPIVTVKMSSFKVAVLGEVGSPGIFTVDQEKISVVEALARAGDLTIFAKRDNVMLIREDVTGQREYHLLNLREADILNSPYYYLQQNDILYVEPQKVKARNALFSANTSIYLAVVGMVASLTSLAFSIANH